MVNTAYGLQYLHEPNAGHQRDLHCDIKSSNILLDQNWKPKISDFGLSRIGPANQQFTFLFSNAVGTMEYFDPLYYETGFLTKESDVYSFGVVLFEVLCGRLCVENYDDIRRFLAKLAQKGYEEKKLDTIINSTIKEQISPLCLRIFSEVAYQCLRRDRKERPSMADIVNKLEIALQCQEEYEFLKKKKMVSRVLLDSDSDEYWETKLPPHVEALIKKFNIPHASTKRELFSLLHKGYSFDDNNQALNFHTLNEIVCTDMSKITENSQETRQKRTRERMSDQEAKDLKAEAREIMPQLYLSKTKAQLQ
ncbi:cytochrome b5-like heme/steroid binding domain-containing protein [Tanacetum coccineum]